MTFLSISTSIYDEVPVILIIIASLNIVEGNCQNCGAGGQSISLIYPHIIPILFIVFIIQL